MSTTAEKVYTEREKSDAQRAAFVSGARWANGKTRHDAPNLFTEEELAAITGRQFPFASIERLRVISDPEGDGDYRIFGGKIEWRDDEDSRWLPVSGTFPTAARVAVWSDLFSRPTELVHPDLADALPGASS